jgi:hypothetical protein
MVETLAPVRRSVICVCGWGGVFPDIRKAGDAADDHIKDGCEGCDHAVNIADHIGRKS